MNPLFLLAGFFLLFLTPQAEAQITWGENITAGSTQVKASHINELRGEIEDLRSDVDAGGAGVWNTGSGGDVYYNGGDVGIGVANPDTRLDVGGKIQSIGTIQSGAGGGGVALTVNDGYGNANITFNHETGTPEQNGNAGRIHVNTDATSNAEMTFELGSGVTGGSAQHITDVMRLGADGRVGIGTTSPSQALDVVGNINATGNINANGTIYQGDGKSLIQYSDSWLRLNPSSQFTSGTYTPANFVVGGNSGFGTTSPAQKVHTSGNFRADGRHLYLGSQDIYGDDASSLYYDSNHSSVTQLIFRDKENAVYGRIYGDGNGANFGLLDGDGNWGMQMKTDVHTGFLVNNSEKMRILANGNVGIGTTAPGAKLELRANGENLRLSRSGTQFTQFINNSSGSEIQSYSPTDNAKGLTLDSTNPSNAAPTSGSNYVRINVRGAEALRVEDGGNVGIGVTNPTTKLDVAGTVKATNFVGNGSGLTGIAGDNLGNHTATTSLNMNDRQVQNIRALQGKDWDDDTGGTDSKYRILYRDGAHMFYDGGIAVGQYANGTWTDLASGDLVVQNQVGIGTTTTTGNLASGASLAIGDSDTGIKQNGDGVLSIYNNNSERIRVQSNGNVGIGDTTPESKLTVAGDIRMTTGRSVYYGTGTQRIYGDNGSAFYADSNHDTVSQIIMRDKQDDTYGRVYATNGDSIGFLDGDSNWAIRHAKDSYTSFAINNSEKMRVKSDGYVGIGTTNPKAPLHVYNANVEAARFERNTTTNVVVGYKNQDGSMYAGLNGAGNFAVGSGTNLSGGDQGFLVRPDKSVEVLSSTGNDMNFKEYAGTYNTGPSLQTGGSNTLYLRPYGAGPTVINANGSSNVGIGTQNPTEKLDVNGHIQAGNGSGAVALTTNDGGGNANLTFNHTGQVPDITGNAGRITVNVDSTSGANMSFQLANGLTGGSSGSTTEAFRVDVDGKVRAKEYCDENGNNCGDASAGVGIHIGDTVAPATTTCGSYNLTASDIVVVGGKFAIAYSGGSGCQTATRTYNGSWSSCNVFDDCRCFVAGTKVHMADGTFKDIELVVVGDMVLNEKMEATTVTELHKPIIGSRGIFTINDKIKSTGDHPFQTTEGWKVVNADQFAYTQGSDDPYESFKDVELEELKVGDVLITATGEEVIESITWSDERPADEFVYSFSMAEGAGYWADGYLVKDLK